MVLATCTGSSGFERAALVLLALLIPAMYFGSLYALARRSDRVAQLLVTWGLSVALSFLAVRSSFGGPGIDETEKWGLGVLAGAALGLAGGSLSRAGRRWWRFVAAGALGGLASAAGLVWLVTAVYAGGGCLD